MILYMFQCHSPKSSHPLPLPQSPKDCSIHRCLFCCLTYRVYHYHLSKFHIYVLVCCIGREGNGTPLQHSCLENPMDRGAWWATVHGVAKSQTRLSDFTFMLWRRKWQPTPVFLPGESQGRGSLVGCRLRGRTESDTTEAT